MILSAFETDLRAGLV